MTETALGAGSAFGGTQTALGASQTIFGDLNITAQTVADARADPPDTPTAPVLRIQVDASARCGIFYWHSTTGWVGVGLG